MRHYLLNQGIQTVVTACPNCYKIFDEYGEGLTVKIVYEFLDGEGRPSKNQSQGSITIHDPCAVRFEESLHSVIRDLVRKEGLAVEEMPHTGKKTFCCGEGGGVPYLSPDLAKTWRNKRREESGDRRMLTYCAGCVNFLHSRTTPAYHLLDFYFDPEATLAGKVKLSHSPITYLNRLSLKKYLRKSLKTKISRERT
jgi:Fe-S oxidoreductase